MDVSRSLVTVLFTDIVGSTERAAELGDDAWGELLARHDGLVREALERCGGREVNTAGDGFLASFPDPGRAIHCACTLREAVHPLGLRIRAGLHVGEVERAGRAVGGIAVHIGARVAALAGANEVLVSSTVHDLVAGSGFGFEDRGEHDLKGVPGRWRIWAVTSEPVRLPLRRPLRRLRDRLAPTRRRSITLAITVTSLVFGALGLHVVLQDRGRTLAPAVAVAESAAPGIAVLPFQVNGPELELLRQGRRISRISRA